jgi:phytoene synthase
MTALSRSYRRCRQLHRRYGTTYYLSTYLLPASKRPDVHALYGFCRYADDIVDDLGGRPVAERRDALSAFGDLFFADLELGRSDDPVLAAVVHTVRRLELDPDCFRRFLRSMAMDLDTSTYETWDDLLDYMDGSAAVIGEMMLPVLDPLDPAATRPARDLGLAFQLTNFLRDVAEDLQRSRIYLPQEDLRRFGADPGRMRVDAPWRELMAFEIGRARRLYASAAEGLELLPARSARCVGTAFTLYSRILERIELADYDVFSTRARVPTGTKLALAARGTIGTRNPYGAAPVRWWTA